MDENWYIFDYTDEVIQSLFEKTGIDLRRKFLTLGEIRKLIGNTKK